MTAPAGELLLVANQQDSTLNVFDTGTFSKIHTLTSLVDQPHEMAWDGRRRLVYVVHTYRSGGYGEGKPEAPEISVIDPDRRELVDVIDIGPFEAPTTCTTTPSRISCTPVSSATRPVTAW